MSVYAMGLLRIIQRVRKIILLVVMVKKKMLLSYKTKIAPVICSLPWPK